ncbi:HypC/HybG/HupF family hydrogenase formation chaperone [bacterium]|nr:HypC/HybG/HupF family hydrogenase formation chaperone [bacterium]
MCLAIPVQIVELEGTQAVVDMHGVRRPVQVNLLQNPEVGDYVLVHAGFAIQKWSEADVAEYHAIMEEMNAMDEKAE